jgi:hypothetical protein
MRYNDVVNYFGHAALALERSSDARFVLGAMLPDLATMLRVPCPSSLEPELREGIAFHHATDAVFHQATTFIELNQEALRFLRDAGVARGPARAIAHIGTEMLLDAALVRRAEYHDGYLEALRYAATTPLGMVWPNEPLAVDFTSLAAHLLERGAAAHSAEPERLVFRLGRALGGRARLEPCESELPHIASFGEKFAARVESAAEPLLGEVRRGLMERAAAQP